MTPLQPEPPLHPVPRSPAPWTLKAQSYLLFLRLPSLPPGAYDPVHACWSAPKNGTFTGGLGAIMIVRYTDTPVGPYDELMLIPGNFSVPGEGLGVGGIPKKALRITRIYVSQRTTVYNGRLNWNIPKHLARFEFSAGVGETPEILGVKVYPPPGGGGDEKPFFSCTLKPWRWMPALPTNTAYVPMSLMNVQPPLPEPAGRMAAARLEAEREEKVGEYDVSRKNEDALLVGTERWAAFELEARCKARGCWVEMHDGGGEEGREEGEWWPRGLKPWSVGAWMEDGDFGIREAVEWKL